MEFTVNPEVLTMMLGFKFPVDATSWAQAPDVLKDMAIDVLDRAGVVRVIHWDAIKSPGEWNRQALAAIIDCYGSLEPERMQGFSLYWEKYLKEWAWEYCCAWADDKV